MEELVFHSAFTPNSPRVTVVAVIKDNIATFGVSRCSQNDQFVKKLGKQRAAGRARSKQPFSTVPAPKKDTIKWFVQMATSIAKKVEQQPRLCGS